MMKSYRRQASSSPTSATVAEEFSSSHNEEDWYDAAASITIPSASASSSSPAAPPTPPLSGTEAWATTSAAINAAIHVVVDDDDHDDEDDDDEDDDEEYYDDDYSACSEAPTTAEETFHLYGRPENFTDRKCEKIVKYAHKRLKKLETSSSSYHNLQHLLTCQAPTLKHQQIQIGNVIGKGAFSSVYSVVSINQNTNDEGESSNTSTLSSDKVVVKFLRSKLYSNPAMLAACAGDLCKEAIMLSHLKHSNILQVKATSPNSVESYINGCHDAFFMVLEKLDQTLSDRLDVWMNNRQMVVNNPVGTSGKTNNRRLRSISSVDGAEGSSNSFTVASSSDDSRQKKKNKTRKSPLRASGLGRLFSRAGRKSSSSSSSSSSSRSSSHWMVLPNIVNLEERLDAALQLADAVSFIHSKGILHRDLKPDNIGFDSDGVLKVFDFDVSRRVPAYMRDEYDRQSMMESSANGGGDSTSTSTSSRHGHGRNKEMTILMTRRVGSPRYMCPESARGEETNLKGDVYTYSLLLHELLTLEKPYDDISNEDHDEFVFYRHVRPRIPSRLPSELKRLIQRGWSEKIRHRPTMSTMTYDLEEQLPRLLPPRTVSPPCPSPPVSTPKKKKLQFNSTNNTDCFASPMSTSVCTAPLTAESSDRQQCRSISKSLKANLLRRSDCVPSLLVTN
mmetsp:Transcript_17174/g.41691  ORF Transcript_17174/g.41691 Transcript_17174/m.41691 type:complete len:675 (+) Transcript_17174:87-2111(+)